MPDDKRKGFRDGAPHQAQKVEEEVGVLANEVVGLAAKVNKIMEAAGRLVAPVDDIRHIRGEDKGSTVPGQGEHTGRRSTWRRKPTLGLCWGWFPSPLITYATLDRWGFLFSFCLNPKTSQRHPSLLSVS